MHGTHSAHCIATVSVQGHSQNFVLGASLSKRGIR